MDVSKELFHHLNDHEEPLEKRLKLADNAYKSSELPLQHKESLLIKWLLKKPYKENVETSLRLLNSWVKSDNFQQLTRNDLNQSELESIIKLLLKSVKVVVNGSQDVKQLLIETVLLFFENRLIVQHFKINLDDYCKLTALLTSLIDCPLSLTKFLNHQHVFNRTITLEENFGQVFLANSLEHLITLTRRFPDEFELISKTVQKCLFHRNIKKYEEFFKQFFKEAEVQPQTLPQTLIDFLISSYEQPDSCLAFKLIFHGLNKSYNFDLSFKLLVLITEVTGFKTKILLKKISSSKTTVQLEKSLEILLELLLILNNSNVDLNNKLKNEISLSDFLQNLLKSIMNLTEKPSTLTYKIFVATIPINPLILETIVNELIIYSMLADNSLILEDYNNFIVNLMGVFFKLHRTQNFVSKMIPCIKSSLDGQEILQEVYSFRDKSLKGKTNEMEEFKIENIFTKTILDCFSLGITNLASWQVINLFKTLLFHLNVAVDEISSNINDNKQLIYLEILCTLTSSVLSSVRIAEHTVVETAVEKFVKNLEELSQILAKFGNHLLNQKHNHVLMRAFLNVCYNWGEIYSILTYYSNKSSVAIKTNLDGDSTTCNITYLHSYISVKQWCLLSERITNFGEKPCKKLLNKLFLQKLRSMMLFEKSIHEDIISNVTKSITTNLNESWNELINDKFLINFLLPKMEANLVLKVVENFSDKNNTLLCNNLQVVNAMNYLAMSKISKNCKQKRKSDETIKFKFASSKIFNCINVELFLNNLDCENELLNAKKLINEMGTEKLNSEDLIEYLNIFKQYPIVFSRESVQKLVLLFLFALHQDICNSNNAIIINNCETLIIGLLHHAKYDILTIFEPEFLCKYILENFTQTNLTINYLTENIFKHEDAIKIFEPAITLIKNNVKDSKYLKCAFTILNSINKLRRTKISVATKDKALEYKEKLHQKIIKLIIKKKLPEDDLIEPFALMLKSCLDNDENAFLKSLLEKLESYMEHVFQNSDKSKGALLLFTTILQNKSQIKGFNEDLVLKVWNFCKDLQTTKNQEEFYGPLVVLIFERVPLEHFSNLTQDLLSITNESLQQNDCDKICKSLRTWESILSCSFNQNKVKIWISTLEDFLTSIFGLLQTASYNEDLLKSIVKFEETLIQTHQIHLTAPLIDLILLSVQNIIEKETDNFTLTFLLSIKILDVLLRSRKALVMDRLPAFLQQYRIILNKLCKKSNADLDSTTNNSRQLSDCAHKLEKLTKNLVSCHKDMARISMYLISDILKHYESVTLLPNVKMHLNNCIYSLISLCDQHAVSFLMRVLSSASTELFKVMYEHYNKYYRFTGKV